MERQNVIKDREIRECKNGNENITNRYSWNFRNEMAQLRRFLFGKVPSNLFRNITRKSRNEELVQYYIRHGVKKVKVYVQYSDRIIHAKVDTKPKDTVVIQVYMFTTEKDDEEVKKIYEELNNLMNTVKEEENLIILGDFNTSVGEVRIIDSWKI